MKRAKVGDYKRKLLHFKPERGVDHVRTFDSRELPFFLVNSVCGLNGSGKTRFLKSIAKGGDVEFEGVTVIQGESKSRYINPSLWVNDVLAECDAYSKGDDFDSIVDQYDPVVLSSEALKSVNYILQSGFLSVEIYNIERLEGRDADVDLGTFQYCVADKDGVKLSSVSLSHGELYVILLVNLLSDMGDCNTLLIDEAEAFLSPVAQVRIANFLLKSSVEPKSENLQIVIATHSPFILDAIGYENSFTMERGVRGLAFNVATKRILDSIGLSTSTQNILLFEDSKAKRLTEFILDRCLPAWQRANIAVALGGESDMRTVKGLVSDSGGSRVVLVFDADIEKNAPLSEVEKKYSVLLPGELSPEEELIEAVLKDPSGFMSQFSGHEQDLLNVSLVECFALDHHDFFCELAKKVRINEFELFKKAFEVWFKVNSEACADFVKRLVSVTG